MRLKEHKERRLHDILERRRFAVGEGFQIIARVQDTHDVVDRVLIHRDPRVAVLNDDLLDLLLAVLDVDEHHVHARREDLLGGRFVKVQRRADHLALAFLQNAFLLDALNDVFQLILGHAGSVLAAAGDFERHSAQLHKDEHQRREDDRQKFQDTGGFSGKGVAVLLGETFRDHLAEGQHQQGRHTGRDGGADIAEQVQTEHGGDRRTPEVDDVVANQNSGQGFVKALDDIQHLGGFFIAVFDRMLDADLVDEGKSGLHSGEERREQYEQGNGNAHGYVGIQERITPKLMKICYIHIYTLILQ